jgi:peptidoglycan hydrolase-like protein with peptidoglycan-binding domain
MTHQDIRELQRFLNAQGFTVSLSGPGSVGNESNYFGEKTTQALRRYQCRFLLICQGSEAANGYGVLGPKTRARINAFLDTLKTPEIPQAPVSSQVSDIQKRIQEILQQIQVLQGQIKPQ